MFWIICAALAGVVAIAIAAPLLRRQRAAGAEPAAAFDLRVYRDQLREVERDLERGVIEASDAERLRVEIGRKVLAADRALERETSARRAPGGIIAIAVLVVLIAGAVALYVDMGAPERSDEPIARRIANARGEMEHATEFDYLIVNDRFDDALDDLAAIVRAVRLSMRIQGPRQAGLLAQLLG